MNKRFSNTSLHCQTGWHLTIITYDRLQQSFWLKQRRAVEQKLQRLSIRELWRAVTGTQRKTRKHLLSKMHQKLLLVFSKVSSYLFSTLIGHPLTFLSGMLARFQEVTSSKRSPSEALHVVTLTQEVMGTLCMVQDPLANVYLGICDVSHRDPPVQASFGC